MVDGRTLKGEAGYVELGFKLQSEAFSELGLKLSRDGRIKVDDEQRTSVHGIFAVGDCAASLAQISVAAGQAAIAATAIHNELLKNKVIDG